MSKRGATHSFEEDWLSFLPDHLLCQILSDLPTKTSVTTSVLSKRWQHLWLLVPILDLNIDDFPDYTTFTSFVSTFLNFSKETCLHKLKLSFKRQDDDDLSMLTSWIETTILRKIQHLEVDCRMSFTCEMMPLTLYLCETLVSLRLHYVELLSFSSLSLPSLKVMHLEENLYADDEVLERLISSCHVLESVTVVRNVDETVKVRRVRSKTLNVLKLVLDSSKSWYNDDSDDWEVF